jgi:chemotaxis protein CheD
MKMLSMGAVQGRMTAKIAGGAVMFNTASDRFNIGERNIVSVKETLKKLRIPIIGSDTGLNFGRTVFFYAESGEVEIKSTVHGRKVL